MITQADVTYKDDCMPPINQTICSSKRRNESMSIIFKDRHPGADCLEESGQISDWLNIQSA